MPKDFGSAGPRAIYPDACRSLQLAAVSADAERIFWRLVSQADDQGRLEGDAYAMKALLVPRIEKLTPRRVTDLLAELQRHELVRLYTAKPFDHLVQLVTWWRWQAGMRRAYPSKWPAPDGWRDFVYGHGDTGFKTYREAAGLDRGARSLPAPSAQPAGNLQADSGQTADSHAGAHAVPVPSAGAGAGAGARDESQVPSSVLARAAEEPDTKNGSTSNGTDVLAAWRPFSGKAWLPFVAAWRDRGLRLPPGDEQRETLLEAVDARPDDVGRWVAEAPRGSTTFQIVAHVLERWHEIRSDALTRADRDDADQRQRATRRTATTSGLERAL